MILLQNQLSKHRNPQFAAAVCSLNRTVQFTDSIHLLRILHKIGR